MTKRKWHSGPPPHVGWWVASVLRDIDAWRWWNGRYWSRAVESHAPTETAIKGARRRAYDFSEKAGIEWCDYYPANARVPRIKP